MLHSLIVCSVLRALLFPVTQASPAENPIPDPADQASPIAAAQLSCWGCNPFTGDCCGGFCICEPTCPGTFCNAFCNPGNALCLPECGGSSCNAGCSPGPCGVGCPDECSPILCPANALCHAQCGGHPCNVGCICEPDCPTTRCSPFCGGDACAPGCADECSPVLCLGNYCNTTRCPASLPQCDLLCGGDVCGPGCPDECSQYLCLGNYCNPARCQIMPPECVILCGGNVCNPGCPFECDPIACPANALCHAQCGGNPCNFGCVCEPDCPTTRCSPFCGGDACAPGCADECSPILCVDNYCNTQRCPATLPQCDLFCGGDPCAAGCPDHCSSILCPSNALCDPRCGGSQCNVGCYYGPCGPGCPDECSLILCPMNVLCHPQCGGSPCNVGCICEPDCPTTRCSPFCPGGDACASGCADECSPILCVGNYCNPLRCPGSQRRCDLLCGGNPCRFGCPDECSQILCPLNSCNEQCQPQCNLLCGGSPCNPGCADECSLVLCPQNHCSPECNAAPQCDLLCGGDPCGPSCPDECSAIVCPTNLLCEPRCGADPCSFGCICEPECWQTQWNPLCGGSPRCDVGLPFSGTAEEGSAVPDEWAADAGVVTAAENRLWGFADLHNHQFANLAFGGLFLAGEPFDPTRSPRNGVGYALHCCGDNPEIPCGSIECVSNPFNNHGMCGCGDIVGAAMGEFLCHNVGGFPQFEGWPRWYSYTHQQVYFEWLKRAWEGGLRLMTMIAVNSEVLCKQVNGIYPCDDMEAVDRQILAAKELEQYIDFWDDGDGRNGSGWYRIAYSAEEARQIISDGRLAVVLGIEVAGLFGCRENDAERCTWEYIEQQLQYYYDLGVRQITPIHVIDNAFGGAALYNEFFNAGNNIINGEYFDVYDCSGEGYEFRFNGDPLLAIIGGYFPPEYPPPPAAHCNRKRLTDAGRELIERMIAKGMIIDVDHMSARTKSDVLRIAEDYCYPVVSSHCGFGEISHGQKNHEGQESKEQVKRIRDLGGLIAPITHQGEACETGGEHAEGCIKQYADIRNDCDNSSRTWAQAYLYAVDEARGEAVAMGTDFNGGAGQPSPRYGPEACNREGGEQREGEEVRYPFEPHGLPGRMDPCVTGARTFNINCDGLAHVGLLPDFVKDLEQIGIDDSHLEPLFRSAEAYVSLWERADAQSDPPLTLEDWRQFSTCLQGPSVPIASCRCALFDLQGDGDSDLADAAVFQLAISPP